MSYEEQVFHAVRRPIGAAALSPATPVRGAKWWASSFLPAPV
jgi:hypothetical protein